MQPEPAGRGISRALQNLLDSTDLDPAEIVHVNAHATSTPAGDVAEIKALRKVFGDDVDHMAVSATKSMTGHLLGGAGGVETVATVLALYHRVAPPTINVDDLDPEVDADIVRGEARKLPVEGRIAALNDSFGFGGHNVVLAFRYGLTHGAVREWPDLREGSPPAVAGFVVADRVPAVESARADVPGGPLVYGSDHLVQPADRGALARVAEGLQFVVPGLAQKFGDLGLQVRLAALGAGEGGAQAVLGDEDVAVDAGDGVEDAEFGGAAVALALGGGAGLGGDLEAQQLPAAQRRGELGGGAGLALPGELGAPGAGCGGLADPVEADARAEHPGDGPLDVRAQRARRGVHVQNSTCRHRDLRTERDILRTGGAAVAGSRVDGEATVRRRKECDVPSVPMP